MVSEQLRYEMDADQYGDYLAHIQSRREMESD
jgi:hypothetical protein